MTTVRLPANRTVTQSPAAGATFSGAHGDEQVVVVTVTDAAGNSTTCEVTLTLVDDEAPTITGCADDQDVLVSANGAGDCTSLIPVPDGRGDGGTTTARLQLT